MISVVVPSYNRSSIVRTLESIFSQKEFTDFEVIVVGRECTDEWINLLRPFIKAHSNFRLLEYNSPGNGPAKNYGVSKANGDFIAFTDDDCIVNKNWLWRLYREQALTSADIVVGPALPENWGNLYLVAHQGAISFHQERNSSYNKLCRGYETSVGTTMNMLIKKDAFLRLKGFSVAFARQYGDDYDFNRRWARNASIRAVYACEAIVTHAHPLSFKRLLKLSFRYGIGLETCRIEALKDNYLIYPHTLRKEYYDMYSFISCWNFMYKRNLEYAAFIAILMQEVKRIGSLYAKLFPESISKVYD